ncbi:restriction endonuclease subunit S [[Clostridium] fimetarium]|uniref:Type I restriction enzyme, S subunit n=1 Tax=[Clostridium] fimetarium TaxID=99656 RepID=A0A1I0QW59_9FIRM|nr:restriction endonuclease subunit S [[Clostridium] fimetarium]SEW31539.1 type I restriction enzyme, S subunit [[Clostridium] fimetarium]
MAKKVKVLKEMMEQALISEEKQLYEIPMNWCWVKFGCLAEDMADGPFGSNLKREHYTDKKEVRIIQLSNIGENGWKDKNTKYTTYEHAKTISRSMVKSGEIVIAKMMPAGRAIKVPNEENAYILSSDSVKFVPKKLLNKDYLLYAINSNFFRNQVSAETQGITRARTSIGKMKTYAFPLPPLEEQKRIIEQIENLFSKLDEASLLINEIEESYFTTKAAILNKAFSGVITKKWREKSNIHEIAWDEHKLVEYVDTQYGYTEVSTNEEIGPHYLRITDIQDGKVNWNSVPHCKIEDTQYEKYCISSNDIVVARTGATTGKSFLIEDVENAVFASYLIRITIKTGMELLPQYLYLFMQSQKYWSQITDFSQGTAQPGVNANKLKELIIPVPSIEEQKQVVIELNIILGKLDSGIEGIHSLNNIKLIKKSILAKAFRGQLSTTDLSEESSIELLKEILKTE